MARLSQENVVLCATVVLAHAPNRQLHYWEMWLLNNAAMTDILKDNQFQFLFGMSKQGNCINRKRMNNG